MKVTARSHGRSVRIRLDGSGTDRANIELNRPDRTDFCQLLVDYLHIIATGKTFTTVHGIADNFTCIHVWTTHIYRNTFFVNQISCPSIRAGGGKEFDDNGIERFQIEANIWNTFPCMLLRAVVLDDGVSVKNTFLENVMQCFG